MNRSSITLHDKICLLDDAKNGLNKFMLSQKYNCDKSTVYRIMRDEQKIRELGQNMNLKRKRNRKSAHGNIEESLNIWVKREQQRNRVLTRELISRAAMEIATRLQSDFVPSSTWIWRWSKRTNIKLARSCKDEDASDDVGDIECIIQQEEEDVKPPKPNTLNIHESSQEFQDTFEEVLLHQNNDASDNDDDEIFTCGKEEIMETNYEPPLAMSARHDQDRGSSSSSNVKKHSWLSQLVLTQIESIHPDDRGDFAWDVHKLIRKYQMKKKMRPKEQQ